MKIAVFMGGTSLERDVSLVSGAAVVDALRVAGHEVVPIDPARGIMTLTDDELKAISEIEQKPPSSDELERYSNRTMLETINSPQMQEVDVVFLILHGTSGEDGTIQAALEMAGIPYTGSGVMASALAMNKILSKKIFLASDIPTPEYFVLESEQEISADEINSMIASGIGYPAIVKPVCQGSSVGLSLVKAKDDIVEAIAKGFKYDNRLLVEKYIPGREVTVGILGNQILPLAECVPESGFYDYEHKYTDGRTQYFCPANLSEKQEKLISELGLKAFKALDCAGFARIDFRLNDSGKVYCLEANTLPGMTSHSLVPKAAKAAGIDFPQLAEKICLIAIEDFKKRSSDIR
ncbi:MAG: D-alanine--D-alanine ligase [candidate division Zixibacteria bacterium]|nr:D-alanine--D-alanine ligase [candidate division Zixibacteria bacterium]